MGHYDVMQVCKKWGHQITDSYNSFPTHRQTYCSVCGSETTTVCGFCNTPIRGDYIVQHVIGVSTTPVPLYCQHCGKPYPWKNWHLVVKFFYLCISPAKYLIDSVVKIFKK